MDCFLKSDRVPLIIFTLARGVKPFFTNSISLQQKRLKYFIWVNCLETGTF